MLDVSNQVVHNFAIKVQGCGTAAIKVVGVGASVGVEDIYHIPVVQTAVASGVYNEKDVIVGFYHYDGGIWIIFFGFLPWELCFAALD